MTESTRIRPHSMVAFASAPPIAVPGGTLRRARGQNFLVDWIEATGAGSLIVESAAEAMLLLPGLGARLRSDREEVAAPGRSVCILPPGRHVVHPDAAGLLVLLRSAAPEAEYASAGNAGAYDPPNPKVAPPGEPWPCRRAGIGVIEVDRMPRAAGRPRLKMLQSATMSINWVEYEGERDRTQLSPHSHDDFEQGSLAIHGDYVHHLRVPWGPDATQWREDLHLQAPAGSLAIVPPGLIHTTEGLGAGQHLLIDVFCPPRADFVAKGWVANSEDYVAPAPS
jgi:hypothetical protein